MEEEHISVADNAAIKDIVEAARTRPHGANCVHSRLGTVKRWEELFSHFVVPFGSSSIRKPDLRPRPGIYVRARTTGKHALRGWDAYHLFGHIYGDKSMSPSSSSTRICSAGILLLLLLLLGPILLVRHRCGCST